ncbi:MAG TPA: 16S rRNA (cytosine(1402)-N(4))-methyltransferase RsmH, partial [Planctomycetota bacterium]|nr:16S rRNA (cytosine(1402)-N(4))-methyltransferase RsmH [Planctomycetota bacterium]
FLIGLDRDAEALAIAEARLSSVSPRFRLCQGPYTEVANCVRLAGRDPTGALDGFLLDLGVSSLQLDRPERGFAFRWDAPLDMRMDPSEGETAAEWLARVDVRELTDVLRRYSDERFAHRIARAIDRARRESAITTTSRLREVIESVLPRGGERIHPATRSFQAIRIAVNRELEWLERLLVDLDRYLRSGARVVILAYHSIEDRIVKRVLGERATGGLYRWLTDGVVRPSEAEVEANPRARSARLRALARA